MLRLPDWREQPPRRSPKPASLSRGPAHGSYGGATNRPRRWLPEGTTSQSTEEPILCRLAKLPLPAPGEVQTRAWVSLNLSQWTPNDSERTCYESESLGKRIGNETEPHCGKSVAPSTTCQP